MKRFLYNFFFFIILGKESIIFSKNKIKKNKFISKKKKTNNNNFIFDFNKILTNITVPSIIKSFISFNLDKILIDLNNFYLNKINSKFISFYSSFYNIDAINIYRSIQNRLLTKQLEEIKYYHYIQENEILFYYNENDFENSLTETLSSYNLSLNNFNIENVTDPLVSYDIFAISIKRTNEFKSIKISLFGKGYFVLSNRKLFILMNGNNSSPKKTLDTILNFFNFLKCFSYLIPVGIFFFIKITYFKEPDLSQETINNMAHFLFIKPFLISFGFDLFCEFGFLIIDFNYLKQDMIDFMKTEEYGKNINVYKKYLFFDNLLKFGVSVVFSNNFKSPLEITLFIKTFGYKNSILMALNKWFNYEYKKPITIFKSAQLINDIIK